MEEVIQYLELKNHYFSKFLSMTKKFLGQAKEERWNDLEYFVDSRERILSITRFYDYKIAELFQKVDTEKQDLNDYKEKVKAIMDRRNGMVNEIVKLDLELISKIDEMKTETIHDLKKSQALTKQLNTFAGTPLKKPTHEPSKGN